MFAQKLNQKIIEKKIPLCVGLDPRMEWLPHAIKQKAIKKYGKTFKAAAHAISQFNREIIELVAPFVPAVKVQIAFFEQYGPEGLFSFWDAIQYAKKKELIVIVDAKRSDISSTAEAYAHAFLGKTAVFGTVLPCYDGDGITINPFLGEDSIVPFIEISQKYGKGVFILVKTSNSGSGDIQEVKIGTETVSEKIARMVNKYAESTPQDAYGYSSIGAIVGAPFPKAAKKLRKLMPHSIFLVPGYGSQGGEPQSLKYFFNQNGLGAIINSSRKIVFSYRNKEDGEKNYLSYIEEALHAAIKEINTSVNEKL